MTKKILSLCVCLALVIGVLPVGAFAAKSEEKLSFYESFDDLATFSVPSTYQVKGRRSRVEEIGDANKAYAFYLDNSKQSINFPADIRGDYYVGFDIKTSDLFEGGFYIKNGSASNDVLKFRNKGILAHNGKSISSVSSQSFTRVVFEVDSRTNTYDVFAGGKKVLSTCYMTDANVGFGDGFGFWLKSDKNAKVIIDNAFVGFGTYNTSLKLPSETFNAETLEETEIYEPKITSDVYFRYQFSEGEKSYGTFNQKDNIIAVETEADGNGVCTFEKINASDMHLDMTDMSISENVSTSLIYEFKINIKNTASAFSLALKDSAGEYFYPLQLRAGGVISGAGASATLSLNRWYTVSLMFDWYNGNYRIYVDGQAISQLTPYKDKYDHTQGSIWRFHTTAATAFGCKYSLDDISIYGGSEPRDISQEEKKQMELTLEDYAIFASERPARQYLDGKIAYHTRSGVLWVNGEKFDFTPKTKDGVAMAPLAMFEKAFGIKGASYGTDAGAVEIDGAVYVPFETFCTKTLGKTVTYVESEGLINTGLAIIGTSEASLPASQREIEDLNAFMAYFRPDRERIKSDYEASALKGVHPRILATEADFARIRELVKTDSRMKKSYDAIIRNADIYLEKEPLKYELRDGVRLWFVSLDLVEYMQTLGMAYQISGDKKYAEKAYENLYAVAKFPDWHPEHHIDVGGMAIGFAIGYDWFYHAFTPEQREILEQGIYEQCFYQYARGFADKSNDMKDGIIATQNHNQVMNAGSVMAALAFADVYPEEAYYLVSGSVRATEAAIHHFAPNGSWFEGIGYGAMTLEYYAYMLSTLETILGDVYTLDTSEGTDKAAQFIFNMQGPAVSFGFNDGKQFNAVFDESLLWFADYYNQNGLIASWYKTNPNYTMSSARAMLWYNPDVINADSVALDNDIYYHGDEIVTARDTWDGTMAFFGARGGRPQDVHGHMDVGSFVYGTGSTPWFVTSPNPDYNGTGYWDYAGIGGMRWKYYTLRAEANNCIIINPDENAEYDPNVKAKFNRYESKPKGVIAVLDMTDSHNGKASSAERAYWLTDERQSLVIRDETTLNQPSEVYSFFYTNQKVEVDGNTVILTSQSNPGEQLKMEFMCSEDFEIVADTPAPLPQGGDEIIVSVGTVSGRIYLRTEGSGTISVTVKLTPNHAINPSSIENYNVPISTWQIPDGERRGIPKLDKLVIDGVEYSVDKTAAVVRTFEGASPEIVAESSKYNVEIQRSSEPYGDTVIKVSDKADSSYASNYIIKYNVIGADQSFAIDGLDEVLIKSIEASDEPEPTNGIDNLIDRNLNTRWSASGVQYALADLGSVQEIDTVAMAFFNGTSRSYSISVEISEDGINYTRIFSGASSGKSADYELFDIGKCKAKYVRVVGSGSTTNEWNSWCELAVGKKK